MKYSNIQASTVNIWLFNSAGAGGYEGYRRGDVKSCTLFAFLLETSPAGRLLAVKLHSEDRVTSNVKYEVQMSLILQWQRTTLEK